VVIGKEWHRVERKSKQSVKYVFSLEHRKDTRASEIAGFSGIKKLGI
jgi:hypothetical protein